MDDSLRPTRLQAASFRRLPWKNGGGVTIDIAGAFRPGADPEDWSQMIWRLGRTWIETPAPFSDLSGYDRLLVVIEGRGLLLHGEDGRRIDATEPLRPVAFPGDWALRSELAAGPVEVVNLFGDRHVVAVKLDILEGAGTLAAQRGTVVLYAPGEAAGVLVDRESADIPAGDALQVEIAQEVGITVTRGLVIAASVTPAGGRV